jgi:Surfeit locus protein 5 subunit 22 of Mediator complex
LNLREPSRSPKSPRLGDALTNYIPHGLFHSHSPLSSRCVNPLLLARSYDPSGSNSSQASTLCLTCGVQPARITYLSNTLIKRIGNIFEEALTNDPASTESTTRDGVVAHTTTAIQQFQLDVESTALVRAAEEIMVLTRSMKDFWLFGSLDTLTSDHNGEQEGGAQPDDIKAVAEYINNRLESGEAEDRTRRP